MNGAFTNGSFQWFLAAFHKVVTSAFLASFCRVFHSRESLDNWFVSIDTSLLSNGHQIPGVKSRRILAILGDAASKKFTNEADVVR